LTTSARSAVRVIML